MDDTNVLGVFTSVPLAADAVTDAVLSFGNGAVFPVAGDPTNRFARAASRVMLFQLVILSLRFACERSVLVPTSLPSDPGARMLSASRSLCTRSEVEPCTE
jgi:hypothetical protein